MTVLGTPKEIILQDFIAREWQKCLGIKRKWQLSFIAFPENISLSYLTVLYDSDSYFQQWSSH